MQPLANRHHQFPLLGNASNLIDREPFPAPSLSAPLKEDEVVAAEDAAEAVETERPLLRRWRVRSGPGRPIGRATSVIVGLRVVFRARTGGEGEFVVVVCWGCRAGAAFALAAFASGGYRCTDWHAAGCGYICGGSHAGNEDV